MYPQRSNFYANDRYGFWWYQRGLAGMILQSTNGKSFAHALQRKLKEKFEGARDLRVNGIWDMPTQEALQNYYAQQNPETWSANRGLWNLRNGDAVPTSVLRAAVEVSQLDGYPVNPDLPYRNIEFPGGFVGPVIGRATPNQPDGLRTEEMPRAGSPGTIPNPIHVTPPREPGPTGPTSDATHNTDNVQPPTGPGTAPVAPAAQRSTWPRLVAVGAVGIVAGFALGRHR